MNAIEAGPEDFRRRYFELKAQAQDVNSRRIPSSLGRNPAIMPAPLIDRDETLPPGWYWTAHVPRGKTLRIICLGETCGVSALFWNAREPSERLNPADSIKVQWTARLTRGKLLLSDMGRVLASITDDTYGLHDCLCGASSRGADAVRYGEKSTRRNSQENFVLAASKHGLGVRDIGPCVSFFAPVTVDANGAFVWGENVAKAGDYVDLRAEMDLVVALSNCPHPLAPGPEWRADPLRVLIWASPEPTRDDFCRSASQEAVRAFENTETKP